VFLGGGVPLVGPQEELRDPSGYTPRSFTSSPEREAKKGFQGFIPTNKQTDDASERSHIRINDVTRMNESRLKYQGVMVHV